MKKCPALCGTGGDGSSNAVCAVPLVNARSQPYTIDMQFLRRALAALLALFLTAPVAAAPALWKFGDADTTIYLFGTIHALPEGFAWRDPRIESALDQADTLVLETQVDNNPATIAALFPAPDPSLPPLAERVPAKTKAPLAEIIAKAGLPAQALDQMPTWQASFMLMGAMMRDLGAERGAGVEQVLAPRFSGNAKKVEALETASQQLSLFAGLSEPDQREFLTAMVDGKGNASEDYRRMLDAWRKGDDKAIAEAFDKDEDLTPHLRDILLKQRNSAWAKWLKERLDTPGIVFVAVGAGHLAGPLSVQKMLAAEGVKVERIR